MHVGRPRSNGRIPLALLALALALGLLTGTPAAAQAAYFPVELVQMVPATAAIPSDGVTVTLLGRGFAQGQWLVSGDPGVQVLAFRVASPTVATATLRVLPTAVPGPVRLDIAEVDDYGTSWQDLIPRLTLTPGGSISAPLSVRDAAVVFPTPGTLLAPDRPLFARGLLATSGSGVIVGRFLLDGVPFDQFTTVAGGGAPVGVTARVPIPFTSPGTHDLAVEVLSPQHVLSGAVRLVGTAESRSALALLSPLAGASASAPPRFRWTFVPGATAYEVALSRAGAAAPERTWRSSRSEFTPETDRWEGLPPGSYTWTVRPLFPGDVLGAPAPARALFVGGAPVTLALAPTVAGPREGSLWVSWEGAPAGALYRLEFSAGGSPLFSALTRKTQYLLRVPAGATDLQVSVTALGPDGRPLGPPARGPVAQPRSALRDEPAVRYAAGPVTVTAVSPADGASVAQPRPPLSARWQGAPDEGDIVLFVDTTDVTAMAALRPGGLAYTPVLPLAPGPHTVRLSLGAAERAWSFTVEGQAPQAGGPASPEGAVEGGAEAPAQEGGSGGAGGAPTGSWTLEAAGVLTATGGDSGGDSDTFRATLTGQGDLGAERGGFFKGTADAAWRSDLDAPHVTENESRSWLLSGGARGDRWTAEGQAGYGSVEIMDNSQFLSAGLVRGGGQFRADTPAGEFGAYASFDDHLPALGSATGAGETQVAAAAYAFPFRSDRYSLRLMGLWTDQKASLYAPGGEGRTFGLLGRARFSTAFAVDLEVARGHQRPDGGSSTSGDAIRLGFSGTAAGLTYALNLRRVESDFANAANPGYNAGGVPDRQGADLNLSRTFGKVATSFAYLYAEDGVGGGLAGVPEGQHQQARLGAALPLGQAATLSFDLNGQWDRSGADLALGLPGVERDQLGLTLSSTQRARQLFFSETFTSQRVRDDLNPTTELDLDSLVLSAGGSFTRSLGLSATGAFSRTKAPFGAGDTDLVVLSLCPSWTLDPAHLTVLPQISWTRTKNSAGTLDTRVELYGLTLQWEPTFWRSMLAFQGSAIWDRTRGATAYPGGALATSDFRYLFSLSLRWNGGRGSLDERYRTPGEPATLGRLHPGAPGAPALSRFSPASPYAPYSPYPPFVSPGL